MPQSRRVRLEAARWRLGCVWFIGAAGLFALIAALSLADAFGDRRDALVRWALPHVMPALALMTSVFVADALSRDAGSKTTVNRNFCRLATAASLFYMGLILAALLLPSSFPVAPTPAVRLAHLELANLWLGPLQGLVVGLLGALFFLKDKSAAAAADA